MNKETSEPEQVNVSPVGARRFNAVFPLAYLMDKRLNTTQKIMAIYLFVRSGLKRETWITRSTIGRDLDISDRQVSRLTADLQDAEIITIRRRCDDSNIYRIVPLEKAYGEKSSWGYNDYWRDNGVKGDETFATSAVVAEDITPGHRRPSTRRKKQEGKGQVGKASGGGVNPPASSSSRGNVSDEVQRLHSECVQGLKQMGCPETFGSLPNEKEKRAWLKLIDYCQGQVTQASQYVSSVCKHWYQLKKLHRKLQGFPDPVFFGSAWFTTLPESLKQISDAEGEPDIFEVVTISNKKFGDGK